MKEQIAGDELWPNDPQARVATAFHRHYPDESNARNLMQRRQEILNDITDTVGATFLAMTYGCARCHTHKFDPDPAHRLLPPPGVFRQYRCRRRDPADLARQRSRTISAKLAVWEDKTKDVRAEIAQLLEPVKAEASIKEFFDKYPAEIQAAITKQPAERNPFEWQMYYKAKPYLKFDDEAVGKAR